MPALKLEGVKPARLRAAFEKDLADAWALARTKFDGQTPYAFLLYGVEGSVSLSPHVLTEESLTSAAAGHVGMGFCETVEIARRSLRYAVPDSPLSFQLGDVLPSVEALLSPHDDVLQTCETEGYALLAKAAMAALKTLDARGLFGASAQRERLTLGISTQATEKDWMEPSVKALNPPSVISRFVEATKMAGPWKASDTLVVSADGTSLYSGGNRHLDLMGNKDVSEIVAYDLHGARVKRRWEFAFPTLGDSVRAIVGDPAGDGILALRSKYEGEECHPLLMRFSRNSNRPVQQSKSTGEAMSFAVAADGSRMALILSDGRLHLLDREMNLLRTIPLAGEQATDLGKPLFLTPEDLLVASDRGILRVDGSGHVQPTPFRVPCRYLASDGSHQRLVTVWDIHRPRPGHSDQKLGYHLLRLPGLDPVTQVETPGLVLDKPALSADGRRAAFTAKKAGSASEYVIVFETETGCERGRTKAERVGQIAFLPDNRTVVFGFSDFLAGEPIRFWRPTD